MLLAGWALMLSGGNQFAHSMMQLLRSGWCSTGYR